MQRIMGTYEGIINSKEDVRECYIRVELWETRRKDLPEGQTRFIIHFRWWEQHEHVCEYAWHVWDMVWVVDCNNAHRFYSFLHPTPVIEDPSIKRWSLFPHHWCWVDHVTRFGQRTLAHMKPKETWKMLIHWDFCAWNPETILWMSPRVYCWRIEWQSAGEQRLWLTA